MSTHDNWTEKRTRKREPPDFPHGREVGGSAGRISLRLLIFELISKPILSLFRFSPKSIPRTALSAETDNEHSRRWSEGPRPENKASRITFTYHASRTNTGPALPSSSSIHHLRTHLEADLEFVQILPEKHTPDRVIGRDRYHASRTNTGPALPSS
jgi:hypothetical protein